jgi:hypothetical protein
MGVDVLELQHFAQSVPWNEQTGWDIPFNNSKLDLPSPEEILSDTLLRHGITSKRVLAELEQYQESAAQ